MKRLFERTEQLSAKRTFPPAQSQRLAKPFQDKSQIKQELGQRIYAALQFAKELPPDDCLEEIKGRLLAIQSYCKTVGKTFIVVEEKITCDQYELGGCNQDAAILFRGPSEDASVAICVTAKGSLLHRNGDPWKVYRNAGDVGLVECLRD